MDLEKKDVDLEEVNNVDASKTDVETNKQQEEQPKTYSETELQEKIEEVKNQMKEDNQKAWNKRWGQEKSKIERENAKKDELIHLLQEQTDSKSIDDLLKMSYEQYGVERPNISNSKDEEILGKYDAKEILELDEDSIEEEANRLAGIKRTAREEATFMELGKHLSSKKAEAKRKQEIKEAGIDEELLNNKDFTDFMSKFNENTSLKDIYDIYLSTHEIKKQKPFSAGSLKDKKIKSEDEYFSEEEFKALTAQDLENPKTYEKAMKSRFLFNK